MQLKNGSWVVVADGEKAMFLVNVGTRREMRLRVVRVDEIENPPSREQGTDRPGRLNDAVIGKSAVGATDWHQLEKDRFAEDLAEKLRLWALEGRYSELALIAAPRTLGTIRQNLHKESTSRLVGEISKDLTNHEVPKIQQILEEA